MIRRAIKLDAFHLLVYLSATNLILTQQQQRRRQQTVCVIFNTLSTHRKHIMSSGKLQRWIYSPAFSIFPFSHFVLYQKAAPKKVFIKLKDITLKSLPVCFPSQATHTHTKTGTKFAFPPLPGCPPSTHWPASPPLHGGLSPRQLTRL